MDDDTRAVGNAVGDYLSRSLGTTQAQITEIIDKRKVASSGN